MLLWQGSLTDRLSEGNGPQNSPLFSRPRAFDLHISRKGAGKSRTEHSSKYEMRDLGRMHASSY